MSALLLSMVGSFVLSIWGRDVRDLAQFRQISAARNGDSGAGDARLIISLIIAVVTAAIAAFVGREVGETLSDNARVMFIALTLAIAAMELLWPEKLKRMREPTPSLAAFTLVSLYRQQTDAGRLLVLAFAAGYPYPIFAGLGGAIGGAGAVALGWFAHSQLIEKAPRRAIRASLGIGLLILAIYIGLSVRGIVR